MYSQYPDVSFHWDVHEYGNTNVPLQEVYLDWDTKILEGRIEGGEQLLTDLQEIIHTQEQRLVKHTARTTRGGTMLDDHHLTARFQNWNLFYIDHPAAEILWSFLQEAHKRYCEIFNITPAGERSIQSWANVLRAGDTIEQHSHVPEPSAADVYMSTNFCLKSDGSTSTVYDLPGFQSHKAGFSNYAGQLIAFPPWIPHHTTPYENEEQTRITIASDISTSHWYPSSYDQGERVRHYIPFDTAPSIKRRNGEGTREWEEIEGIDGSIARIVNFKGELTEEDLIEIKEQGTEFSQEAIVPEGVPEEYHPRE